jgi:hypothetical protein
MTLDEIFDSDPPSELEPINVNWRQVGPEGWGAGFQWGDRRFVLQLIRFKPVHLPATMRTFEASFYLADVEGDDAFSTVDSPEHPLSNEVPVKVYGVVLNALLKVWKDDAIDAIYFSAEPRHSSDGDQQRRKEQLYEMLARRAQRMGGGYLYVHRSWNTQWVLSKNKIDNGYWENVLYEGARMWCVSGYRSI